MQYQVKRIGDFCRTGSGSTPSRNQIERYYEGGHIPWVKSGELREDLIASTEEHVTDAALHETSIKLVPAGAILIAMYGATVGRLAILGIEATTNQAVCHIVPAPELADARYLYHAVSAQVPAIIAMGVGGAQPNISQAIIKELKVPLPPLPEQRRIAAILDQADALRAKRREALAELDQLTQSIFIDMFGDPVTNPMGWPVGRLDRVSEVGSSKRVFVEELVPSGIPFFRGTEVGQLGEGQSVEPSLFISKEHYERLKAEAGVPTKGDLLLPSICPDGRIYMVQDHKPFYFKDGRVLWINVKQGAINSVFLRQQLKQLFISNYSKIASGTTFAELKIFALKNLGIYLPPLDLQEQFSAIAGGVTNQTDIYKTQQTELEGFFSSLQHRAFRGEL